MTYTIAQAKPLLTQAELELFEASYRQNLSRLGGAELNGLIKRTRDLRDKYRDLYRRQTADTRSSGVGHTGEENSRTREKAELMAEALQRLEAARA